MSESPLAPFLQAKEKKKLKRVKDGASSPAASTTDGPGIQGCKLELAVAAVSLDEEKRAKGRRELATVAALGGRALVFGVTTVFALYAVVCVRTAVRWKSAGIMKYLEETHEGTCNTVSSKPRLA